MQAPTKQKIIAIVGPTASGKTDLAIRLAKKFKGEIISADSRQVYRDLDIGTAKAKGRWGKNVYISETIPHFCIDFVPPKRIYTVTDFKICATQAVTDIASRNRYAFVVGGTGLWVDALAYGIEVPDVAPNLGLRKKLEKKSTDQLFAMLQKLDPRRASSIERYNPRRLIRAIEVAKILGSVPDLIKTNPYDVLWIGLSPKPEILHKKITLRSSSMIKQGLIRETKKLLAKGVSKKRIREFGFEYAVALDCIEKKITRAQLPAILSKETIAYAKRQMRWFKRNADIHWVKNNTEAKKLVMKFI